MNLNRAPQSEAQLSQWMTSYGDVIIRTCYLLSGDLDTAHFVTQRVFTTAYEEMASFYSQREHAALPWLLRIALGTCPCREARPISRRSSLVDLIGALSPGERKAFLLCLYHELSVPEAAWILGQNEAHVRRQLQAACRRFPDRA